MQRQDLLKLLKPRSSRRQVVVSRGTGVPPAVTSSFRLRDYPRSAMAAAAVGLFAVMLVLVNLPLASCESFGTASRGQSSETGGEPAPLPPGAASPKGVASTVNLAPLEGIRGEPEMRVRVREAASSVNVQSSRGVLTAGPLTPGLVDWASQPATVARPLALQGVASVSLSAGRWTIANAGGSTFSLAATSDLGLLVGDPALAGGGAGSSGGGTVLLDGAAYPGRLRLVPRSDLGNNTFDVIEYVPLETYLPGVIAKELYTGWPLETYRVQAVCARSYALHERARARSIGSWFDIKAGEVNQAYIGSTKNPTAAAAVGSTRGVVVAWEGHILRTYYSSTCGGRVASASDTWPTGAGFEYNLATPLQAVHRVHACQNAPEYRWTIVRPTAELAARIRAFGESKKYMVRQLKSLAAITPLDFNVDGRPRRYKIIEPGGKWYELAAEDLRVACNTAAEAGGAPVSREQRIKSSDLEFAFVGGPTGTVTISGRGFGHGVGMCQYCTLEMAKNGEAWKVMLARFYPGANIVRAYE